MAVINLGRVGYVHKGAYAAATTYQKYDVVLYNHGSYLYIGDTASKGHTPTDTAYWQAMLDPNEMNAATEAAVNAAEAAHTSALELAGQVDRLTTPFSITGDMVNCHPVSDYPLGVISHIEPVQAGSGDPSPSNVRPISGLTGAKLYDAKKNLFDASPVSKTAYGITYKGDINGRITINGTKQSGVNIQTVATPAITLLPGTYTETIKFIAGTIENQSAAGDSGVMFGINRSDYGQRTAPVVNKIGDVGMRTFTITEPLEITSFDITPGYTSGGEVFNNVVVECQFEIGSAATDYVPGACAAYAAQFGQTVYGGTLDWKTGKLTKAIHGIAFTGSETFAREKWCDYGYEPVISTAILEKRANYVNTNTSQVLTNNTHFTNLGTTQIVSGKYGNGVGIYGESTWTKIFFRVPRSVYGATTSNTDAELLTLWKNWLAAQSAAGTPFTVVYDLYTPEEIQLTPQQILSLDGENNLWSDCGQTTVNGPNSPKVMEKRIAALEAAIANMA